MFWLLLFGFVIISAIVIAIYNISKEDSFTRKFNERQMQAIMFQSFETFHILTNTKNIDTYKSRFDFFLEKLRQLIAFKKTTRYNQNFGKAILNYRKKYPDRDTAILRSNLFNPNPEYFDLAVFFKRSAFECLTNSLIEDQEKIKVLKTEKAKQNREQKIEQKIDDFLVYLSENGISKDDELYKSILEIQNK
ncbi:hypothetical protein [Empedobacter brevis]|uniref:hypothetical protein n=1 Tax=Empedobacter brevis TaxID=247 RepID=UPI0039B0BA01